MGADPLGLREILPSSGASETKEEAHGPNPPLLRLPPEIQAVIVECIFMPSDLKNLCLVCKELRDVATRALHVDVTIDLDEAQHQGRGFFQHGHYGHRFVRRLSFSSSLDQRPYPDALYENNDRQHIEDALRSEARKIYKQARWRAFTTLQLLPQDTLTHFSHVLPLSSSLMTALYTQQRKLKSLALGPVFSACTGELAQPKQWLAELECLEIPEAIGNDEDLAFYGRVIIDCPKLMELTLRTDRATGRQDLEEGFQDRTASDGLLYKMLFQNTVSQSKKLELRSLTLKMVDLSHSGRTFVNAFRFEKLEHLSLISCDGSDVLLRAITAKYKSTIPALQSFGYHYDRNHRCSQRLLALQDFFESFSGLKYLTVQDERGKTYLDLECLASHAPTLRQLCVGMGSNFDDLDHLIPPVSNARTLLGRCKRLRRLAIAHPLVVPRSLGIDWPSGCKGFVVSSELFVPHIRANHLRMRSHRSDPCRCLEFSTFHLRDV